jgi:hypothetical protein
MKTSEYAQAEASTIINQLGGNRFKVMTGSKDFMFGTNDSGNTYLQIKLASNKISANRLVITLVNDLYNMEFSRVTLKGVNFDKKVKKSFEGIYADQLQELFTEATGLYTSL